MLNIFACISFLLKHFVSVDAIERSKEKKPWCTEEIKKQITIKKKKLKSYLYWRMVENYEMYKEKGNAKQYR